MLNSNTTKKVFLHGKTFFFVGLIYYAITWLQLVWR